MRKLADSAVRAKLLLERENSALSADCERMISLELTRALSGYFELSDDLSLHVEKGAEYEITIRARAVRVKSFGVARR